MVSVAPGGPVCGGGPLRAPPGRRSDGRRRSDVAGLQLPGVLAGLYAWRQGRGIFRFDPELADAVAQSDLPPDVGADMLFRLPEWGVYVDPGGALGADVLGFWVYLGWDATNRGLVSGVSASGSGRERVRIASAVSHNLSHNLADTGETGRYQLDEEALWTRRFWIGDDSVDRPERSAKPCTAVRFRSPPPS